MIFAKTNRSLFARQIYNALIHYFAILPSECTQRYPRLLTITLLTDRTDYDIIITLLIIGRRSLIDA